MCTNCMPSAALLAVALTIGCQSSQSSAEGASNLVSGTAVVTGTATYRERIAMPPNAVFEAVLLDVSVADAPATEIARSSINRPPQVPISFSISFDPARIDARRTYSVRGRILVEGQQWFTTDQAYPVLTRGAGTSVQMLLRRVSAAPAGQTPAGAPLMGGEMTYMADAARFTDCMTGQGYPIAMEVDYRRMERTYSERVSAPGAKLYVTFEGSIVDRPPMEGTGLVKTVLVSSFVDAWPNQNCERSKAHASLNNMYWRITQLAGSQVPRPEGDRREPQVILRDADGKQTYSATVGCNSMSGNYTVTGDRITFAPGPSTLMACVPPLDTMERQLRTALGENRRWRIFGNTLELRDDAGTRLALFEATPMK